MKTAETTDKSQATLRAEAAIQASPPNIRRLALIAEIASIAGMVFLGLAMLYYGYLVATGSPALDAQIQKELAIIGASGTISTLSRWVIFFISLIPLLVGFVGLCFAQELFRGYRAGEIFTVKAAQRLTTVGWSVVLLAPAYIISNTGSILALTMLNQLGMRSFSLKISEGDIFALIFGLLIVVVGHIMREATLMAEENKSFI